ncbi:MAG: PfkB family carbohydrate kinase [Sumerlaeia bacterium]
MSEALVVGSVALDSVETPHGNVSEVLGGSASYGCVSASYFAPVKMVAVVGEDFPSEHVGAFEGRGIDTSGLKSESGQTFRWSGYYLREMGGAHTNTTALNVFENFRPTLDESQRNAPFVFLANIQPGLQLSVLDQLTAPKAVLLDTMNFWIEGSKKELTKVIERVNILLLNEEEARQYMETPNLIEAGLALQELGPQTVVIKKGEHGSLLFQRDRVMSVPAFPLRELKDPTGAGDTFAGGLVGYLARLNSFTDEDVRKAVVVGTAMASFVVEDFSLRRTLAIRPGEIHQRVDRVLEMMRAPVLDQETLAGRNLAATIS